MTIRNMIIATGFAMTPIMTFGFVAPACAETEADLSRDADQALQLLYSTDPRALEISKRAKAVLVFPSITKAGLVFGGAYGEGVLQQGEKVDGYYSSFTGSWGLQAGAQSYGYAVFLMNDQALQHIHDSRGWEVGVGPTIVIVNKGDAKNLSTTTLNDNAYAFIFDQQGLMAGVSIEGTKISEIKRHTE